MLFQFFRLLVIVLLDLARAFPNTSSQFEDISDIFRFNLVFEFDISFVFNSQFSNILFQHGIPHHFYFYDIQFLHQFTNSQLIYARRVTLGHSCPHLFHEQRAPPSLNQLLRPRRGFIQGFSICHFIIDRIKSGKNRTFHLSSTSVHIYQNRNYTCLT